MTYEKSWHLQKGWLMFQNKKVHTHMVGGLEGGKYTLLRKMEANLSESKITQPHKIHSHTEYAATQNTQPHKIHGYIKYTPTQNTQLHRIHSHIKYTAT